ncbi:MAG: hypothetical protein GF353_11290 [Candidatus Lokiarchaeota archaeon]|nr:hypothetical protein [Candidatus Lokiarchaeota archaeon]
MMLGFSADDFAHRSIGRPAREIERDRRKERRFMGFPWILIRNDIA